MDIKDIDARFRDAGFPDYATIFASEEFKVYMEGVIKDESNFTHKIYEALNLSAPEDLTELSWTWRKLQDADIDAHIQVLWEFAESRTSTKSKLNH